MGSSCADGQFVARQALLVALRAQQAGAGGGGAAVQFVAHQALLVALPSVANSSAKESTSPLPWSFLS